MKREGSLIFWIGPVLPIDIKDLLLLKISILFLTKNLVSLRWNSFMIDKLVYVLTKWNTDYSYEVIVFALETEG